MTQNNLANASFAFDFNAVSVSDNPIDSFPFDTPLAAIITGVAYRNLAKKGSGEEKIRLVVTQKVYHDNQEGTYDTIISPNQGYLLKQYLVAVGVDANALSNQSLDQEGLESALKDNAITITFTENEYNGKKYRSVRRVTEYGGEAMTTGDALPF